MSTLTKTALNIPNMKENNNSNTFLQNLLDFLHLQRQLQANKYQTKYRISTKSNNILSKGTKIRSIFIVILK